MVWNMRNNQSIRRCCAAVLIGRPVHMGLALSDDPTRTDRKAEASTGGIEDEE
jgi:hypothetical protein